MRDINRIILHMSLTPPSADIGAEEIRWWHIDPNKVGGPYRDIGYHYVIRRSGLVETGRELHVSGAHVGGHNNDSIGICIVGGLKQNPAHPNDWDCNYTSAQWRALDRLCRDLLLQFPGAQISGHRDWDNRGCPGFDAREWSKTLL